MAPTAVEFGVRYGDDSGWERQVAMDRYTLSIEVMGSRLECPADELDWLIEALSQARKLRAQEAP